MEQITYISEHDRDWSKALNAVRSLDDLVRLAEEWRELCADALEIARAMTPADFREWKKGVASERRGKFAGEEFAVKYGSLMMPEVLFKVSMMAHKYKVPWGLMYLRLKESGNLNRALSLR